MRTIFAPLFLATVLGWLAPFPAARGGGAAGDDPAAAPVGRLAAALAAAPTEPAQETLLAAAAGSDALRGDALSKALADRAYQITIQGDYPRAEMVCQLLLRLARRQDDPAALARAKTLLGRVLTETGDKTEAAAMLAEALRFYEDQSPPDPRLTARAGISLAIVHLDQANYATAVALLNRALAVSEAAGDNEVLIPALNTLGNVLRAQGQPERALAYLERARQVVGDDHAWNMAFIFNNLGQVYDQLGQTDRAIEFIGRARAVAEKNQFRPRVATSLAVLGKLHLGKGENAAAGEAYAQSLALAVALHDSLAEGRARLGLAETARARGDLPAALAEADHAADLYRRTGQRAELAAARTAAGRCLRGLNRPAEARAAFAEAIAEVEAVRGQVAGGAAETERFFEDQVAPYQETVALLAAADRPAEALAFAERASARTLLDILTRGNPDSAEHEAALSPEERGTRRQLTLRLAAANRALTAARAAEPPDEAAAAAAEAELRAARLARENTETALLAAHPDWQRARPPLPPAVDPAAPEIDAARLLAGHADTAVLRFAVTAERTVLFVLRARPATGENPAPGVTLEMFPLDLGRTALARQTEEFRTRLAQRGLGWQASARALYDALFKRSEAAWRDAETLVIVPDGPLWELPFQALQAGNGRCLLEERTLRLAPSLAFLARTKTGATPRPAAAEERLLAIGNPALGDKVVAPGGSGAARMGSERWEPLPAAEAQVAALEKIYSPAHTRTLVGAAARESVVKRAAGEADVLHFATHGVLNDQSPLYSYLLLAQTDLAPDEDGRLEAWKLMRLPLHARLAVLSACETARGRVGAGEGVIGLSWAFFAAGCPACVVSQWKVDSTSNTDLMVGFHRRLHDGMPAARALREASLELAKRPEYRHPFYWAPFVLVGDGE